MQWSDLNFKPPEKTLRLFAALWGVLFTGLGCWQYFQSGHQTLAIVFICLAIPVCASGLIWPQRIRPVFVGATILTFPIGWTVSRIVLAATFYLLLTPIALFFRAVRRDALSLRYSEGRDSYWKKQDSPEDLGSYFKQF